MQKEVASTPSCSFTLGTVAPSYELSSRAEQRSCGAEGSAVAYAGRVFPFATNRRSLRSGDQKKVASGRDDNSQGEYHGKRVRGEGRTRLWPAVTRGRLRFLIGRTPSPLASARSSRRVCPRASAPAPAGRPFSSRPRLLRLL